MPGPKPKITKVQERKMLALHGQEHTVAFIARSLGLAEETTRLHFLRMGVDLRGRRAPKKILGVEVDELVASYAAGASTDELAEAHGVSAGTIANRLKVAGVEMRPPGFRRGEEHHSWVGGRIEHDGYISLLVYPNDPFYPMARVKSPNESGGRYVLEHRLVMAKHLGRCLTEAETVHHKDLDHSNNKLDNLQLRHGKHGKGASFRCCDCGSYNVEAASL